MPNERSIDIETLLSHAHRSRDLLTGAKASLVGVREVGAATACNLVLEARAQLDGIVHALESLAAVEAEAKRQTHAQTCARIAAAGGAR